MTFLSKNFLKMYTENSGKVCAVLAVLNHTTNMGGWGGKQITEEIPGGGSGAGLGGRAVAPRDR